MAEYKQRIIRVCFAQLNSLAQRGNGKIPCPVLHKRGRNAYRAQPVCIGLNHGHYRNVRPHHLAYGVHIRAYRAQIDLYYSIPEYHYIPLLTPSLRPRQAA